MKLLSFIALACLGMYLGAFLGGMVIYTTLVRKLPEPAPTAFQQDIGYDGGYIFPSGQLQKAIGVQSTVGI